MSTYLNENKDWNEQRFHINPQTKSFTPPHINTEKITPEQVEQIAEGNPTNVIDRTFNNITVVNYKTQDDCDIQSHSHSNLDTL